MVTNRQSTPPADVQPSPSQIHQALALGNITNTLALSFVKTNISIESVARYLGGNRYTADDKTSDRIRRCIEPATELVNPRATYTFFPVSEVLAGKEAVLQNGSRVMLPENFDDPDIQFLAAIVATLGEGLEKHCRKLAGNGKVYESLIYDAIGTVMLDLLIEKICATIDGIGCPVGLTRGTRFAPGIDGYPLEQQHHLFQMADNESITVFLNSSAIMVPAKSISFFTVLNKTRRKKNRTDKCGICRLANCQYRRTPAKDNPSPSKSPWKL